VGQVNVRIDITTPCLKNVPPLICYNVDTTDFEILGRNVTDKVSNQNTVYYATSNNLCFCTIWQNGKHKKLHISLAVLVHY